MNIASIILCAGVGSRLKSAKSKILHEVCGRPLGYWSIKNALAVTTKTPIVVVGYQREAIEASFKSLFHDQISFAAQDRADGTGGAVRAALKYLDPNTKSVLVLCGDTPLLTSESLKRLIMIQRKGHVPIAMLSAVIENPHGYGRIVRNRSQQIIGIVEDREASPLEREICEVNPGVYVFDADFLRDNINKLENNNNRGEFYLTDLIARYIKNSAYLGPVESVSIPSTEMQGINTRSQLAVAQKELNRRLLNYWMLEGVTVMDPDSTYIDESVKLGKDVILYPGVHLRGETHIGEHVIIENGSVIKDSVLERGSHILPYSVCDSCYVGENSQVGPFARLRPDARLERDVKVGNFVEIKRSKLKRGVKASHLAYIGDADIGSGSNIGAGTITCNYDGKNKHRTVIGEQAFVGSNTTLVAPLAIGSGAYVAGGSTITESVGSNDLAIGRARQISKTKKTSKETQKPDAGGSLEEKIEEKITEIQ